MAVSDRIVVMRNAEIAASGHPRDLYERPPSAFVAGFMGEANILDGVFDGSGTVTVGSASLAASPQGLAAGPVKVVVRPAALTLRMPGDGAVASAIPGVVASSVYLGSHDEIVIETAVGRLLAFGTPGSLIARGTKVMLEFDAASSTIVAA